MFVIGKPAYMVKEKDAWDYVAGITILNDLTCRDTQKAEVASGSRFWTSKNAPGFGPLGPCIITMDEVPDPYDIWVTCSVNGEQRMRVNTSDQIWKLPRIIEHFSRLLPLQPGDMFSTGAPGGVAVGKPNAEDLYVNRATWSSAHSRSPRWCCARGSSRRLVDASERLGIASPLALLAMTAIGRREPAPT